MRSKIPITVIVTTRNEEARIGRCLCALHNFSEIIVVDSGSTDKTKEIAAACGARVENFQWDGRYPKKRQWCLDHLQTAQAWIFFVDADEIVTPELVEEMRALDFTAAGYFVKGIYIFEGRALRFGLRNNKLALIHRRKMEFPVIDDLDMPGMGEMEGHYQPVLKKEYAGEYIGRMRNGLLHDAYDNPAAWQARHERYAAWEREMDRRKAWPVDPKPLRAVKKNLFKSFPLRPHIAFLHSYILKLGFLDGTRGFKFARSRYAYYRMI